MTSSGEREALTSTVERLLPALASPWMLFSLWKKREEWRTRWFSTHAL